MRRFVIFTEPSKADPAWVVPVAETTTETPVQMSTADDILKVIWSLQFDLGRASGRTEEEIRTHKYLESKGWTPEQIKEWLFCR